MHNSLQGFAVISNASFFSAVGHLRCLQLLLAHGADVDRLDVKAQTPLFTTVCGRYLSCVIELLRAGANPNGSHLKQQLARAHRCPRGDPEILRQLLLHGAEVNARSKVTLWASGVAVCSGPLYLSAIYGHLDCFKMLLLYGADPNYNSPGRQGERQGHTTEDGPGIVFETRLWSRIHSNCSLTLGQTSTCRPSL